MTRLGRVAVGLVVSLALVACGQEQEPDVIPTDGDSPSTTSRLLEPCPPDGPDDTTAAAGCLGEDGTVQRP